MKAKLSAKGGIHTKTLEGRSSGRRQRFSAAVNLSSVAFDPHAPELTRCWSTYASSICCVNVYQNAIAFSYHHGQGC